MIPSTCHLCGEVLTSDQVTVREGVVTWECSKGHRRVHRKSLEALPRLDILPIGCHGLIELWGDPE